LTPQFDVALEFQNILNRQYELWDGYRERGIFAALGIKSRF
jgi:outer membrane receptor protein involved in Fe transport